jgi:hypothetical protein
MISLLLAFLSFSQLQQPSVLQCDADPSGHKDSAPAFRSCLEQYPAGDLLVPPGTYLIYGP